ncbi:MAG: hypothetical protein HKM93_02325 [Desulfobacteraceae bacterium]|nr:hypothetical protein [Desulfobacteraceae bacterium]
MMKPKFDEFFSPDRLSLVIDGFAAQYPDYFKVHEIGYTHQNRPIYLLEITDLSTDSNKKPAFYIDAATHADEVTGSSVAVYTAWSLLDQAKNGVESIVNLLKRVTFHIVPILNPDGVEVALKCGYRWISNGRYAPEQSQPGPGFYQADVDGDGWIYEMRIPDPNGEYKISQCDNRLMVHRAPDEEGGQYYRILPEGFIRDWDGASIDIHKPVEINLNRGYPFSWTPPRLQLGASPYPVSEPENRAVVEWFSSHSNIAGAMSYHTNGGVILRPFSAHPDSAFPSGDMNLYKALGAMGTEETGYPLISTFEDFTPVGSLDVVRGGTLSDFTYEELGIPTFCTELWNVYREAGAEVGHYLTGPKSEETMLKVLQWVDENVPDGFRTWRSIKHPQLGQVDIGGWNRLLATRNPPGKLIEKEAEPHARFAIRLASTLPKVNVVAVKAECVSTGIYKVQAIVENNGYMATNLTRMGIDNEASLPVTAVLKSVSGDGVDMLDGAIRELGHLSGRADRRAMYHPHGDKWGTPRRSAVWVIKAEKGTGVSVEAGCPRAGYHEASITLE